MGREPRDTRSGGAWWRAVAVALLAHAATAADILVIFPTTAQSHYRVVRPLIHGLLDRGHRVLAITNFPDAQPRANLSHIDIAGLKSHSAFGVNRTGVFHMVSHVSGIAASYEPVLGHPPVADLLRSGRAFDLVIAEYFTTTPMFAPIAAALNAPIVGFCPMMTFPSVHRLTGVPTVPSYMPDVFNGYPGHLSSSSVRRFVNAAITVAVDVLQKWVYACQIRPINRRHYGSRTAADPLWVAESLANVSVVLTNNYRGTFMNLPQVPGIVEVGGIHVRDAKLLPQVRSRARARALALCRI